MSASRIFGVDDDRDIRGLVRHLLERAGHQVREAPDGKKALRELFSTPADLVILDIAMPELDG